MRSDFVLAIALLAVSPAASSLNLLTEENPPLNFSRNGELVGTSVAVVREMVRRSEVKAEIRVLPWSEVFERAKTEPDVCAFSTARLPARNALFQWVGPISRGYWSAFALEGFADYVRTADDLKKYRIGVVRDARARYLEQRGFSHLVEAEKDTDNPGKLTLDRNKEGAIDLWITQGMMAADIARKAGAGPVKEIFAGIMSQDYWLACNPQVSSDTIRSLSQALGAMRKDGTYRKLTDLRTQSAAH